MNELNTATSLQNDPWAASSAQDAANPMATPADAVGDDPWAASSVQPDAPTASAADASTDPWGGSADAPDAGMDWLSAPATASPLDDGSQGGLGALWQQIRTEGLPVQDAINDGLNWVVDHFRPFFQAVRTPIDATLNGVTDTLLAVPMPVLVLLIALLAWQFASRKLAIGSAIALLTVAALGIWSEAMVTLALVLTSLFFCIVIGLPAGILLASSDRAQRWTRPLLDAM
ncbi:MAG: proline/glycine betaine ABC transporter permease ProW, partial [Comamonas sp.]